MAESNDKRVWTLESLYVHLLSVIEANDKRYEQRFQDTKESASAAMLAAARATAQAETSRASGIHEGWGYAVGVIGLLVAIATLIWKR